MNKEELQKISNKLLRTYYYLNQKEDLEKENILKAYLTELKKYSCDDIIKAIDELSKISKFVPTVAEIKVKINEFNTANLSNVNWNSSYWYKNLRDFCDGYRLNKIGEFIKTDKTTPYYDITKGPDYPLQPFKN